MPSFNRNRSFFPSGEKWRRGAFMLNLVENFAEGYGWNGEPIGEEILILRYPSASALYTAKVLPSGETSAVTTESSAINNSGSPPTAATEKTARLGPLFSGLSPLK